MPKCFNYEVMANCKNFIKYHRYDIYKAPKNHGFFNCSKIWECNLCINQKSICQCIIKIYYAICLVKIKSVWIMRIYPLNTL